MNKILFLLGLSTSVFSQQSDTTIVLEDVVITATRSEISLEDSPVPTEVIGKEEIEKLNLITMQDLLQQKGFFVAPVKSGGFQLRGLSSEYVLVMIDGVPVAGRESGALDVSNINLDNVERVEIVKGSMSSLWGNHAIGGVINIITKKNGQNSLAVNTQYGSNNTSL
jgi:outer membrane receptor for ferrienterochelin and colicins